eukprot:TRINITY_DN7003_c0_g1_i1.p1 TRINITY_DN7003_c0_g1~~TRINITY_DN7003_c0_g1_i1.p1  ORF type:complete len:565 (+),score=78.38 TRINITY_DN7003_c0_g1_i1:53-1747(+)
MNNHFLFLPKDIKILILSLVLEGNPSSGDIMSISNLVSISCVCRIICSILDEEEFWKFKTKSRFCTIELEDNIAYSSALEYHLMYWERRKRTGFKGHLERPSFFKFLYFTFNRLVRRTDTHVMSDIFDDDLSVNCYLYYGMPLEHCKKGQRYAQVRSILKFLMEQLQTRWPCLALVVNRSILGSEEKDRLCWRACGGYPSSLFVAFRTKDWEERMLEFYVSAIDLKASSVTFCAICYLEEGSRVGGRLVPNSELSLDFTFPLGLEDGISTEIRRLLPSFFLQIDIVIQVFLCDLIDYGIPYCEGSRSGELRIEMEDQSKILNDQLVLLSKQSAINCGFQSEDTPILPTSQHKMAKKILRSLRNSKRKSYNPLLIEFTKFIRGVTTEIVRSTCQFQIFRILGGDSTWRRMRSSPETVQVNWDWIDVTFTNFNDGSTHTTSCLAKRPCYTPEDPKGELGIIPSLELETGRYFRDNDVFNSSLWELWKKSQGCQRSRSKIEKSDVMSLPWENWPIAPQIIAVRVMPLVADWITNQVTKGLKGEVVGDILIMKAEIESLVSETFQFEL